MAEEEEIISVTYLTSSMEPCEECGHIPPKAWPNFAYKVGFLKGVVCFQCKWEALLRLTIHDATENTGLSWRIEYDE